LPVVRARFETESKLTNLEWATVFRLIVNATGLWRNGGLWIAMVAWRYTVDQTGVE